MRGEQWLMSSDGGNPRATGFPGGRAAWLTDASGLVILQPGRFVRLDIASGKAVPVLEGVEAMPFWAFSADQRWIASQSSQHGTVDILATSVDGSAPPRDVVKSPDEDAHPFFSPAGRWLYFQKNHKNLWRVPGPAQGWAAAEPEQVTRFPEQGLYLEEPQISRDGHTLVFTRASILGDIWLLRLAGR